MLLDYSNGTKGYRVLDLKTNTVTSCSITFDEREVGKIYDDVIDHAQAPIKTVNVNDNDAVEIPKFMKSN